MHPFVSGLLGGALIGLSAGILLLFSGDILGASGIVSSVGLRPISSLQNFQQHWKLVFIASFLLTSHIFLASEYKDKANGLAQLSWAAYLLGGFFVGFGTKLGNGCTSGHGICGLPRLSKRSFVAVVTFMTVGVLTAFLTQPLTSPLSFDFLQNNTESIDIWRLPSGILTFLISLLAFGATSLSPDDMTRESRLKLLPSAIVGVLFALGLYVSQMVYPVRVLGFLNVGLLPRGEWDATLIFVMGGGVMISMLAYQLVEGYSFLPSLVKSPLSKPLCVRDEEASFCLPNSTKIDSDLIFGAISFGFGWGISGLCPGPALVLAGIGVSWVLICYWPAFFVGAFIASLVKERNSSTRAETDGPEKKLNETVEKYGSTVDFSGTESRV